MNSALQCCRWKIRQEEARLGLKEAEGVAGALKWAESRFRSIKQKRQAKQNAESEEAQKAEEAAAELRRVGHQLLPEPALSSARPLCHTIA